jgi:hypothetical protein
MCHKYRQVGAGQHMTGESTEDHFAHTGMTVAPHHQNIRLLYASSGKEDLDGRTVILVQMAYSRIAVVPAERMAQVFAGFLLDLVTLID